MEICAEIFWSESMALGLEYRRSQGAVDYVGASDGELGWGWNGEFAPIRAKTAMPMVLIVLTVQVGFVL